MSVSGRPEITTAAAWIDELRTMPSSPRATSMICFAVPSVSYAPRSGSPGFRQSSKDGGRPCCGAGGSLGGWAPGARRRGGDELGELVAGAVVVAQHAGGVAGGRAREHAAERDDLRDRVAPVL